eukprot:11291738-Karenia_brevis.AAC.1
MFMIRNPPPPGEASRAVRIQLGSPPSPRVWPKGICQSEPPVAMVLLLRSVAPPPCLGLLTLAFLLRSAAPS